MYQSKIVMPQAVQKIISQMEDAGYEAYAVGGCVRDSILGRTPNDWDITTSAHPEDVKRIFPKTFDTGIAHGTVTVLVDHVGYEITTYRIDGKYEDGRHPTEVTFTPSLEEDLLRRDFTINAMAYNDRTGLVDLFGGMEDIDNKIIRCVGDAEARFTEDALRILRAIRFSAQLGYEIEPVTRAAIRKIAPNLKKISAERIQVELVKTLISDNPGKLKEAYEVGLTEYFLPELDEAFRTEQNNPNHCYTVGEHIIRTVCEVKPDKVLRLTMLLHDIGKPLCKTTDEEGIDHFYGHQQKSSDMAKEILKRLKFDNETIARVSKLVLYHDERIEPGLKYMRRAVARIGDEAFPDLFEVNRADLSAQSSYRMEEKQARLQQSRADYAEVTRLKQCVTREQLAINGTDLIQAGFRPGKEIGSILEALLEDVLEEPEHNEREYLLKKALSLRGGKN